MTQLINQFALSAEKGQLDLQFGQSVVSCKANEALTVGVAVKLADVDNGVPHVAVAADTDLPFGFVVKNLKKETFAQYDAVEVAIAGSFMYMIAGAAIVPQAEVMYVAATAKVITATGTTKAVCGYALDKAAADGDLIRVAIQCPNAKRPSA